ncbi:hypothetical protein RF11_07051 [Thelohanellus kitauei]|uniref:Uncharacterized protein n=1 Tax=Thelohanellus kitauei TaxID=669202 RepID=A0A0C2MYN4_THEKT|nr:hypothetical protein RF11_07051 [Thelohanellus kitauei]
MDTVFLEILPQTKLPDLLYDNLSQILKCFFYAGNARKGQRYDIKVLHNSSLKGRVDLFSERFQFTPSHFKAPLTKFGCRNVSVKRELFVVNDVIEAFFNHILRTNYSGINSKKSCRPGIHHLKVRGGKAEARGLRTQTRVKNEVEFHVKFLNPPILV